MPIYNLLCYITTVQCRTYGWQFGWKRPHNSSVFFLVQITATVGWEVRHQQTYQQQIVYFTLVPESHQINTPHFGTVPCACSDGPRHLASQVVTPTSDPLRMLFFHVEYALPREDLETFVQIVWRWLKIRVLVWDHSDGHVFLGSIMSQNPMKMYEMVGQCQGQMMHLCFGKTMRFRAQRLSYLQPITA